MIKPVYVLLLAAVALSLDGCARMRAQPALKITYGSQGVQTLSFGGMSLADLGQYPADAFHIWHMKATDLQGHVLSSGQLGWGENNQGRSWNASTQTWTYTFAWGSISLQFHQLGNTLDMHVTEINKADSGIIFDGAAIYPLVLHFPQLPSGFASPPASQLAFNTAAPSVTVAEYGHGQVIAVNAEARTPLYSGFQAADLANAYAPLISSTTPDGLATFQPHHDRPLAPGQTDSFSVSLRFAPSGVPAATVAADAYHNWTQAWPSQVHWADHRIIGTIYLASSPQTTLSQLSDVEGNPRNYVAATKAGMDIRTSAGLASFQAAVLRQAQEAVRNLQRLHAQGAITWDMEGQQFPQPTSYVGAPDQLARVAPEMESTLLSPSSPYAGMKLVDAYFKVQRDAGFRVGVCVRPQRFKLGADGTATQTTLPDPEAADELYRKVRYAHDRWGATLFYVDSTVGQDGATLDAGVMQKLATAFPDSLVIPEESTPKSYAYTAPFRSFLFHGDLGTAAEIYNFYPNAFSANLINDADPYKLRAAEQDLVQDVRHGDILMVHADYWHSNNAEVLEIYRQAAAR